MEKMIDWWSVRGEVWGILGLDFKVQLFPDDDLLTKDYDAYTAAEQISLDRGFWRFVTVTVTPMGITDLTDHVKATQRQDGVEWGEMPGGRVDREHLFAVVEELVGQAVRDLRRGGFEVATSESSPFTVERQKAPF